jgi:hypothetical protein
MPTSTKPSVLSLSVQLGANAPAPARPRIPRMKSDCSRFTAPATSIHRVDRRRESAPRIVDASDDVVKPREQLTCNAMRAMA